MGASHFTRKEVRKRHPGLKKKNNAALDRAITELPVKYGYFYSCGSLAYEFPRINREIDELLGALDEPARAALISFYESVIEDIKKRPASSLP
jgi:hypothetical protein